MSQDDRQRKESERLQLALDAAELVPWENDLLAGGLRIFAELGYSEEEAAALLGEPLSLVHPDDVGEMTAALSRHLSGVSAHYRCEFRLRDHSGAWVWYANHGKIVEGDGAAPARRLVGVAFNIDERKQVEARLHEQQRLLAESEARHRELLRNLHTGIVAHAPDSSILYSNPRASTLLGVSEAQMRGMVARDGAWCFVDEESRRMEVGDYPAVRVIRTHQPVEGLVVGVRQGVDKDIVWLLVNAFPVFDNDGNIKQVIVNFDDISARKLAEEKIHHLAFYDPLTGLPNRRLLMDRLQAALAASARTHQFGAVLFLDLDNFKAINDVLGHAAGDMLLVEVAARIGACLREVDMVARIGGDEFVVLIGDIAVDPEEASQRTAHIAEKIRFAVAMPYWLKSSEQRTSPSIGISLFSGHRSEADTVLRQADMAMYRAKDAGRNTMRFFSAAMQQAVESRAALEADLRSAVSGRQLCLYYQIQVDAAQRIVGAEALVRWLHPRKGLVAPGRFIPIAEESALILEIGGWVLETACAQLARWQEDPALRQLTLAVNVSARQFRQADFVDMLRAMLERHRFEVSRLKLELTESMVLSDVTDVVVKMKALRGLGLVLSMDDFGTGYSSLAYLKKLPLDQLKIDQSFVCDVTSDAADAGMVKTILDLARNFSLEAIAEGVETEGQLAFLKKHGCGVYQGFLFGRPVPLDVFEALTRATFRGV
ncbi:putative bifunctional diguanylate cyclase/phosphodiesterase [Massilia cavernae]|uniref:EAL domain-containing protein n=1 Tax=Massilia cavernae TaxID=2320864 RepID=A0A418XRK2_9BURK|nr:EAL domain-containing protein [Massilia cavernae]RJG15147.1 EAL domain-containing protein [Massilia cavernae]